MITLRVRNTNACVCVSNCIFLAKKDTAHWKSRHKLKRLKVLYEGDEARGVRELIGVAASDFTPCFAKEDVDTLFENPLFVTEASPDAIYVTVDPNGGGASKMAISSGYYNGLDLVVSLFFFNCPCVWEKRTTGLCNREPRFQYG